MNITTTGAKSGKLWLDWSQNEHDGRAFGYIGSTDDGECGMFFTWPSSSAEISTYGQLDDVLDSLEYDETYRGAKLASDECRSFLDAALRERFSRRLMPAKDV